jgi:hypothetical protein
MAIVQTERTTDPVIETALERFRLASEADNSWRMSCLDDLDFSIGNQWPLTIETIREKDGRPCLVMDQIQQSIRLVCNQYRQQPPAITINPIGDGADVETADIIQGIVRHIEVNSDAQVVYEKTHEGMVRTGFHSCRLLSDYVDDDSDEQEVIIEWIKNAFSVYWQPGVPQEKARWCFIVVDMPRETYKAEYPTSQLASSSDWTTTGNQPPTWVNKDYIRVAEYFEIEDVKREGKRDGKKVVWRKITAYEELDKRDLPGTTIPVFTAYADDIDVDGKRYVAGLVRNAKGPQRQYNYMVSGATEAVSLAPKAPWVAVEGQLAGRETQWEQANIRNFAVLQYKQVDISGKPAPPPQRNVAEPPIQGMAQMIAQASNDLKASLGIYDPSLGQRRGDESGKAIERLQAQGNVATLNYSDNMSRMMKRLGKSILEWMKVIYDEARVQRIINPDGTVKHVVIHNGKDQLEAAQNLAQQTAQQNAPAPPPAQPGASAVTPTPQQIMKIYDIGVGKYDVIISVGPTYQSKRQEAVATQMDLLKSLPPQVSQNLLDLILRNMDIPQSNEMADRIKKMLPPQLVEGDQGDPAVQLQHANAQLQQFSQQHQLMTKALEEAHQVITTKQIEQQGKTQIAQMQEQTKTEIVKMQEATKIAVAQINASKAANESIADQEIKAYDLLHSAAHDVAMQAEQHAHEQSMAQQGQAADAQSQASDQAAAQQSQAADQSHDQNMQQQQAEQQPETVGAG